MSINIAMIGVGSISGIYLKNITETFKEINLIGSWDYSAEDYPTTIAFLKQAREMNIPIGELITHRYPLEQMNEAMEMNVSQQGIKICYIAQ